MQGEEKEAAKLYNSIMRQAMRAELYERMTQEVETLCGPRYRPDPDSPCHRAGSEKGVAFLDGAREEIRRPRVRHGTEGEVELANYRAASSPRGLFEKTVAGRAEGLPVRGAQRALGKAVGWSSISRIWVEKSRDQLDLLCSGSLDDADWL